MESSNTIPAAAKGSVARSVAGPDSDGRNSLATGDPDTLLTGRNLTSITAELGPDGFGGGESRAI